MVRLSDVFGIDGNLRSPEKPEKVTPKKESGETPPQKVPLPEVSPTPEEKNLHESIVLYREAMEWVKKKFKEAAQGPISDIAGATGIVERFLKYLTGDGEELLVLTLALSPKEDPYLYYHCVNVTILSIKVGQGLRYRQEDLVLLGIAALVHDLGMAKVPADLVERKESLSDEEMKMVRKHPVYTIQLLEGAKGLDQVILDAVSHEHERLDGSGYPKGLRQEQVSEFGGIIALVDVYEALTHPRPYRKRHTPDEAMKMILYSMEHQFKNGLVQILKALVKELSIYPVGSFVQLNTSEIGQVVKVNKNFPLLPVIDVWLDTSGSRLSEIKRVNLAQEPLVHIKKSVDILDVMKGEEHGSI